jgi:hypothetical protein
MRFYQISLHYHELLLTYYLNEEKFEPRSWTNKMSSWPQIYYLSRIISLWRLRLPKLTIRHKVTCIKNTIFRGQNYEKRQFLSISKPFQDDIWKKSQTFFSHSNFLAYVKKSNIYDAGGKNYSSIKNLFLLQVNLIYRSVQHTILKIIQKFCSWDYELTIWRFSYF